MLIVKRLECSDFAELIDIQQRIMQHFENACNRDGRVDTRRAAGQEVWGTRSSNRAVWHFSATLSPG
jgi:hypothetical protein